MRRGQLLSQPLIFIFAMIVGALLLVWGIKTVIDLKSHGSYVQLARFHEDFGAKVRTYYNLEEDSSAPYKMIGLPSDIKYICFRNAGSNDFKNAALDGVKKDVNSIDPDLKFLLEEHGSDNVFYLPTDAYDKTIFEIKNLRTTNNPLCVSRGKTVYLANRVDRTAKKAYVEIGFPKK